MSRRLGVAMTVAIAAALCGALTAFHYQQLGLTLSHYDARGHLVVARRVLDSLTPGWQQLGAVWLPLPHLLNLLPVQIDALYRTGASATAISVVSFAIAAGAVAWIVIGITDGLLAGVAAAAVFAVNANVLYLQATPMTEPLLLGLLVPAVGLVMRWCRPGVQPLHLAGIALALACLTRYEAWPVTAAALALAVWVRHRQGEPWTSAVGATARLAAYPAAAVLGFLIFSRVVIGQWFVASGFFVPENPAQGSAYKALSEIAWGVRALSGPALFGAASLGTIALVFVGLSQRRRATAILPLSLLALAVPAWAAFLDGHPYRIRYMVPLMAAQAIFAGTAVAIWKRTAIIGSAALLALVAFELRPFDPKAPMLLEALWDQANTAERQRVTDCLTEGYQGETVMASMGSLGHYMQDLSRSGFRVRDFLHEGNGDLWLSAMYGPRPYAGWVLVEEKAEGGDALARAARTDPTFLDGFSRVCDGAGVTLYRREVTAGDEALD